MKVVINTCYGGYGLSDAAYVRLGELGIPIRKYVEEPHDPKTGLFQHVDSNEGEIIFDRELTLPGDGEMSDHYWKFKGALQRYWETWSAGQRQHPLVIQVIEELGEKANGPHARLKIVDIPDGTDYEISEYDGNEHIAERHATWS